MTRKITHFYSDPLDLIWTKAALDCGFHIERTSEVYASFDGKDLLFLSTPDEFDPDDSLAQLIYHELCHALVSAPEGLQEIDWGLDNTSEKDLVQEYACHRLQAHMAEAYGLRDFFAVTTNWRPYWDELPPDPLFFKSKKPLEKENPHYESIMLGRKALDFAKQSPFEPAIKQALYQTALIAKIVAPLAAETCLWRTASLAGS